MLRVAIALCALLCFSTVRGQPQGCKTRCCAAERAGVPTPLGCKCDGIICDKAPFGWPSLSPPSLFCPTKVCCQENPPLRCKQLCSRIKLNCGSTKCSAQDCCTSAPVPPACRVLCSLIDCAPVPPPPAPAQCPDTRECCREKIPDECKETCKFAKPDCRCIPENCCFLAPNCDFGICAAVTCLAPPIPSLPPRPIFPIPSPGDNGGCNANVCCPPDEFPRDRCDISICAAVTCAVPPPPGCTLKSCCEEKKPQCTNFCKGVDCSKPCCSPTLSEEIDPDDVGCRPC